MGDGDSSDAPAGVEDGNLHLVGGHPCKLDAAIGSVEADGNRFGLRPGRVTSLDQNEGRVDAGHDGESIEGVVSGQGAIEQEKGDSDTQCLEEQMLENKKTWELAIESGAMLCNEEDDIMAILQAQNEEIAQRRKLAKQKAKIRRCRLKNIKQVWCAWISMIGCPWSTPGSMKAHFLSWTEGPRRKEDRKQSLICFCAIIWNIWLKRNRKIF
ncbi:uncharacterized protein DS421_14g470950 [Arachis hypogaea]|nr:uncharacterized protein DS421_14g470950 [Arachis hypogaea]